VSHHAGTLPSREASWKRVVRRAWDLRAYKPHGRSSCWVISTTFGAALLEKHPPWVAGVLIWLRFENTEATMNSLIYLVGLIVVVLLILSFFGLR
jgi:hypothetical protein